jgi:low temperature requirement protein LtrA
MIAMLVAAIAVPSAFGADAILFGTAFLLVRLLNLGLGAVAGRHDPGLRRALVRFGPPAALAPLVIVLPASSMVRRNWRSGSSRS